MFGSSHLLQARQELAYVHRARHGSHADQRHLQQETRLYGLSQAHFQIHEHLQHAEDIFRDKIDSQFLKFGAFPIGNVELLRVALHGGKQQRTQIFNQSTGELIQVEAGANNLFHQIQHLFRIAFAYGIEQVEVDIAIDQTQDLFDRSGGNDLLVEGGHLIQQTFGVAQRPVRPAGKQVQSLVFGLDPFGFGDSLQMRDDFGGWYAPKVESLAARQNRLGHLLDLGRCKDEHHVCRWLLQGLEQSIERRGGQHVHFIDYVDFVAAFGRHITHHLPQLAHVVNAVV